MRTKLLPTVAAAAFALATAVSAEPLKTFTVTSEEGKTITLTRDLPDKFFGNYHQKDGGMYEWKYHFEKTGTSWFWEQSGSNSWDESKKITFTEWGVVVENGKIKEIEEKTTRWGKDVTLKGMVLIYKRLGEYRYENVLLEENGKYSIKYAQKVD